MFQPVAQELAILKSQFVTSSSTHGGRRKRPYVFTEQGVAMLSTVLSSPRAVRVNIAIMRAFIKLRETLGTSRELARKFDELEARVGAHDEQIAEILEAIRQLLAPPVADPKKEIGFHVKSLFENYEGCCGEGFWLGPRRRGRRIPAAGCNDRANAGRGQKTRRPEGFRGKGRPALLLLSRRSTRDILLRRALPYSLSPENFTPCSFQTGSKETSPPYRTKPKTAARN